MKAATGFIQANDLDNAVLKLQRVLKLEPSYYQAASQLGALLHHLGREEEAVIYLRKSFEFERGFMAGYVMCVGALLCTCSGMVVYGACCESDWTVA
jgi:tetratricopeptide (TPR) repeat protein